MNFFYETPVHLLFKPIIDFPIIESGKSHSTSLPFLPYSRFRSRSRTASIPDRLSGVMTDVSGPPPKLPRHRISLFIMLIELLSFCVLHHAHRASYFILSNPISKKVFSLLKVKDKPLRYGMPPLGPGWDTRMNPLTRVAVLRYARTCFRTPNHFIHRYFVKQDLIPPLLELLEEESTRDNMLSSSCMDVLTAIRTVSLGSLYFKEIGGWR